VILFRTADAEVSDGCAHRKYSWRVSSTFSVGPGSGSVCSSRRRRDVSARTASRNLRQATVTSHPFGVAGRVGRPDPYRLDHGVLNGVLGRREIGSATDEDPDDRGHQFPQRRFVHSVTVGASVRNGRISSHS
jgi:hypothetical protein